MIKLLNDHVLLEPPQHLLVLWITEEATGSQLTIFHESGYQADGFVLTGRAAAGEPPDEVERVAIPTPLPTEYVTSFPELRDIDVRRVPVGYRTSLAPADRAFQLRKGVRYTIAFVAEVMWQETVIAE